MGRAHTVLIHGTCYSQGISAQSCHDFATYDIFLNNHGLDLE